MKVEDIPKFAQSMLVLGEVFNEQVSETRIEAYRIALDAYEFDAIDRAMRQAVTAQKFFPKPAELVELLEGSHDDRAGQSWHVLLEAISDGGNASVKFLDPAAAVAVDVTFGGYLAAARMIHEADEPMVAHYRKTYVQAYQTARKFPREVETYRAGVFEFQNSGGGTWSARMANYTGPVRLLGLREMKEVRLPFDAATGKLTDESRLMLEAARTDEGARRLLAVGATKAPQLPPAPNAEPISHKEAMKLLKAVESQAGTVTAKPMVNEPETAEEYEARVSRYRTALLADTQTEAAA